MAFQEDLYTRLSGFAGLTALVGTRIYPNKFRQGTRQQSAIRYARIASERESTMSVDVGFVRETYQFDIVAATYSAARAIEKQLLAAIQRWRDAGIGLQDTFIGSVNDDWDDETEQHRIRVDAEFIVNE